ncbi:MAG TPA: YcgL domain-containing protein [Thiohalobacter sp.]|nr:YcgL domain-containing protein [Thiohalobacter sp.]
MQCVIYKGDRKADTYLYVETEGDFSRVPDSLLQLLGNLEQVMTLELHPERALARADPEQVREQLRRQGFYLQLPPENRDPVL